MNVCDGFYISYLNLRCDRVLFCSFTISLTVWKEQILAHMQSALSLEVRAIVWYEQGRKVEGSRDSVTDGHAIQSESAITTRTHPFSG